MIEKMKFVTITGPKSDIDRVSGTYLTKYEMHLESALSELKAETNLMPFIESNPYEAALKKTGEFLSLLPDDKKKPRSTKTIEPEQCREIIEKLNASVGKLQQEKEELTEQKERLHTSLKLVSPFRHLDFNIPAVLDYEFIKFRFGKIARNYFQKFSEYVYDNLDAVFLKGEMDEEYVWGVYFVARSNADMIDTILTSLHFERIYFPDEFQSTPQEACRLLLNGIVNLNKKIKNIDTELTAILENVKHDLYTIHEILEEKSRCFNVRKLAACTDRKQEQHYILCGWMPAKDAAAFQKETENDDRIYIITEDDHSSVFSGPPTKLKNIRLFRPFEMFVKMYGLPDYNEADPTPIVALTYAFIFGVMFGDVGQGLCLVFGGFLLYKLKGMQLAAIISAAGIFSTFFGFMFGSVFGFEDIIEARWLHPAEQMSTLPFIGKLNTIFIIAIAFGMLIIVVSMILHIVNSFRAKDIGTAVFDPNGLAGLVFYGSILAVVLLYMTGHNLPGTLVLVIMFGIPLLLIALKEPLTKIVEKKKDYMPESKVMFVVEAFFELFEMLLSYFSNTLSFVRIGAFAVSHAAMMEVVLMLAGAENGSPNWLVVILGNIFVCGMEGLIVGIQVLRLEYYEMFSRFYKGSGREFIPYLKKEKR